jgi:hypothetical protein
MASKRDEIYAIGRHFTDHYYKVFNREPQELHKLYGQTATLTSGWEGNEKDETFFGLEEIKNKFSSANLGQVKVLSVISSQESANGGVMVVVTGSWEPSNQSGKHTRRFIETFFLMRGSRQHTFYIQNDIMYILQNNPPDFSEVQIQQASKSDEQLALNEERAPEASGSSSSSSATPEPTPSEPISQPPQEAREEEEPASEEKVDKEEGKAEQTDPHQEQPEKTAAQQPADESKGSSYVGRLRGQHQDSSGESREQTSRFRGTSKVFVRLVPDVSFDQVMETFAKFGAINDRHFSSERSFAILGSSDPEFAKRAVAASPVNVAGKALIVEFSKSAPQRGGGYNRGRGRAR